MAFRTFERGIDGHGVHQAQVSRRALLRGGALAGAGALLAGLPMGRAALAHGHAAGGMHAAMPGMAWPGVTKEVTGYVADGKVANMVATFGWGTSDTLQTVGGGKLTIGQPAMADADSLYRIYSMTKPVTGMATMMLIEDGKLGLDQPLADILPAYANMTVQKTYDGSITDVVPAERPITIRHLLTHTAGLGYGIIQEGPIKDEYERLGLVPGQVSRIPIPGIGRSKPVEGLANFADRLAEVPLVYQPGTKWSYSVSLDLLGRVIEVASGVDFATFLQDNIFDPAGMDSTYFQVPRSEVGRFTTNYGILNGTPLPVDPAAASIYLDEPAFPFGGAGLVSSPRDYDRFLRMLLGYGKIDGTRVMGELAVRVGTRDILPSTVETAGTWIEGQGFGAGGRVTDGAFGWGGAAGTAAFADFKSGLRAQLYTQYMPSGSYPIQNAFPDLVRADLAAMTGGASSGE